jgi:hypothetical protein
MMVDLVLPSPTELGAIAPVLGPWFSDASITLNEANEHLGVGVTIPVDHGWLPPATGLLSFFVTKSAADRPYGLAHLRRPNGQPAFDDDRVVALFRLLPEVETALERMMRYVPTVTHPPAAPPEADSPIPDEATRPRIRYLALELNLDTGDSTNVLNTLAGSAATDGLIAPSIPSYVTSNLGASERPAARARYLGFKLEAGQLDNAAQPIADRKRPGRFDLAATGPITPDNYEFLLKFPTTTSSITRTVTLYAFDWTGQPVDPGAVAAWWAYLANHVYDNLWAAGLPSPQRTVSVSGNNRLVYLTDLHGNPLANTHPLMSRLNATHVVPVSSSSPEVTPLRRNTATDGSGLPVRLTFDDPPLASEPDGAPFPRVGAMPTGRLVEELDLWPGWGDFSDLTRDFVQVALVDLEFHLVGQARVAPSGANEVTTRRAADQARGTTRVNIAPTTGPVFQKTIDEAAAAMLEVFDGPDTTQFVAQGLDRDFGPWGVWPLLPDVAVPTSLPDFGGTIPADSQPLLTSDGRTVGVVHPLIGGGDENHDGVLVEFAFDTAFTDMWVRIWEGLFDVEKAERRRGDGGGCRVAATGRCFVALQLPQRTGLAAAPMGLDLVLKTATGRWFVLDLRFEPPAPASGDPLSLTSASGDLFVCETGTLATAATLTNLPSGGHLVALPDGPRLHPALINPASIPPQAYRASTLVRRISGGDRFILTAPAFSAAPDGAVQDSFAADIPVNRLPRLGRGRPTDTISIEATDVEIHAPGSPLAGMERLEYAAANLGATAARAALATTPALGRYHEFFPHQDGHPGMPGTREHHGMGIRLNGPAALLVAEYLRDRRYRLTFELLEDAWNNQFSQLPPPTDSNHWVALLRTEGRGVEGESLPQQIGDIPIPMLQSIPLLAMLADPLTGVTGDAVDWVRDGIPTSGLSGDLLSFVNALNRVLSGLRSSIPTTLEQSVLSTARALDRRLQGVLGPLEGLVSLIAAVKRARHFIYVETPAFDSNPVGQGDSALNLFGTIRERMQSHAGLKLLMCIPLEYGVGIPTPMHRVRNQALQAALDDLRSNVPYFDQRVALFSPNAGPGRSLYLSATTVIIDDVYALTGTTHLWRRGLSYDQSLKLCASARPLPYVNYEWS